MEKEIKIRVRDLRKARNITQVQLASQKCRRICKHRRNEGGRK